MAIGLARMLNVRFPLNFASPYQSRNIAEFWRRWHITLGAFLREYVYFPLGGSRCGALRHSANLLGTMLLCGLWHGAAWRFVLWGGLHGTVPGTACALPRDAATRACPGADAAGGHRGLGAVPRQQRGGRAEHAGRHGGSARHRPAADDRPRPAGCSA